MQLLVLCGFTGKGKRSYGGVLLPVWRKGTARRSSLSPQPRALPGSSNHLRQGTHFSSRTGARVISVMRLQYQIMIIKMLGVRKVFMANHTLVKPPF